MSNLVTGLIALVLVAVFLGKYAITLNAIPLWIIIVGTLVLIGYDYVTSIRATRDQEDNDRT